MIGKSIFPVKTKAPGRPIPSVTPASTQSWLPIVDVDRGFICRRDGSLVAVIRVSPVNFNLLSDNEKLRKIRALEEVLNGIEFPYQMISIARPVDLDAYLRKLDDMKSNASDRIKARLLAATMQHAAALATSGEAMERQFYILLSQESGKKSKQGGTALYRKAMELASSLTSADLSSQVCTDEELRDLLFIFTNPSQAAFERAPATQTLLPPTFVGAGGRKDE